MPGTVLSYNVPDPEPIEINLSGEAFLVMPIGGLEWRDFVKTIAEEEPDNVNAKARQEARQLEMLFGLVEQHMEGGEYQRFEKFARQRSLGIGLLMQIVQDVVGASAGRPTQPPSPSRPGRQTTGRGSTAAASSPASTSTDSPSPDA